MLSLNKGIHSRFCDASSLGRVAMFAEKMVKEDIASTLEQIFAN